jgi:hypothetical protein
VLSGIGGKTVAEAQENVSYHEFRRWMEFRHLRGPLHFGTRIDRAAARMMTLYINANRSKGTTPVSWWDFLVYEEEPAVSLEDARKTWN